MPNSTPKQDRTCSRECPGIYIPYYQTFVRETPPPRPGSTPPKNKHDDRSCITINCNLQ